MTGTTTNDYPLLRPEQVGELLILPALAASVAAKSSTSLVTESLVYRIPVVSADPAAAWVAEGSEIAPTDAALTELEIVPSKVAGLSVISRELSEDSDPAAAEVVGGGLSRDVARRIDEAFMGNFTSPAPAGLGSLVTSVVTVPGGATSWVNLDPFAAALMAAEQLGATITAFITSPTEALTLTELKESSVSIRPLLGADPTAPTERSIYGVPLLISPYCEPKTVWAIPAARTFVIVRSDARIETDKSVFFTSDRVAVKATMRVGFGFPHPLAIVKIVHA